jgi:hypothetical protein
MNQHTPNLDAIRAAKAIQLTRAHLNEAVDELPHHVTERLRAARVRALSQLNKPAVRIDTTTNGLIGWLQRLPTFARTMVIAPALFLAIFASQRSLTQNNEQRMSSAMALMNAPTSEAVAPNIDAILNEEIPLQAYLDNDFNQFNQKIVQQPAHGHVQKTGFSHGNTR